MAPKIHRVKKTLHVAGWITLVVHVTFCVQAILTAPRGGMIANEIFGATFFPHFLMLYLLPPEFPISFGASGEVMSIDWLRFALKLIITLPGSIAYGLALAGIWNVFSKIERRKNA